MFFFQMDGFWEATNRTFPGKKTYESKHLALSEHDVFLQYA